MDEKDLYSIAFLVAIFRECSRKDVTESIKETDLSVSSLPCRMLIVFSLINTLQQKKNNFNIKSPFIHRPWLIIPGVEIICILSDGERSVVLAPPVAVDCLVVVVVCPHCSVSGLQLKLRGCRLCVPLSLACLFTSPSLSLSLPTDLCVGFKCFIKIFNLIKYFH